MRYLNHIADALQGASEHVAQAINDCNRADTISIANVEETVVPESIKTDLLRVHAALKSMGETRSR